MAVFLVEAYVSGADTSDLAEAIGRVRRAAEQLRGAGVRVRYLRSILVPGDETCFHLFESPSSETVEDVCRRAALTFDRVSEAVEPEALQ